MKQIRCILVLVALSIILLNCICLTAVADRLYLPSDLEIIDEEAFYGDTSIDEVVPSYGLLEIRSKAFANSSLSWIYLDDCITYIADDAFDGPDKVTVEVDEDCYAYDWAVEHGYIQSSDGIIINETNFPDPSFREFLEDEFDINEDGSLSDSEIDSIIELDVSEWGDITDLTGIFYFTALRTLDCSNNEIETLDLSQNKDLEDVYCYNNAITDLDISGCDSIKELHCGSNQLESLDLSNMPALEIFDCGGSENLTELYVTGCSALRVLRCYECGIDSLSLEGCAALEELDCNTNSLTELDLSEAEKLNSLCCYANDIAILDVRNNPKLVNCILNADDSGAGETDWGISYQYYCIGARWVENDDGSEYVEYDSILSYDSETDLIYKNTNSDQVTEVLNRLGDKTASDLLSDENKLEAIANGIVPADVDFSSYKLDRIFSIDLNRSELSDLTITFSVDPSYSKNAKLLAVLGTTENSLTIYGACSCKVNSDNALEVLVPADVIDFIPNSKDDTIILITVA